jgi:hypothetical protein
MADHHISLIGDRQADCTVAPRALRWNALFRALSVATQRCNARDIIDRAGRLPEHIPNVASSVRINFLLRVPSCFGDLLSMHSVFSLE